MWLDSLRRLVEISKRKLGSRSRPQTARQHRRVARLGLETLEDRLVLSTLTVMNVNDSGAGSLRADIAAANPGDTIQFSSTLAGKTVSLTSGDLLIDKSLTITGLAFAGKPNITISNAGTSRIFDIEGGTNGVNVTLSSLTVQGGTSEVGGGLNIYDPSGTVTLNNLNIIGDSAVGGVGTKGAPPGTNTPANPGTPGQLALGGGVFFTGGPTAKLVISNSTFQNDRASGGQGGRGGYGGRDFNGAGSGTGIGGNGGAGGNALGGALYISGGIVQLNNDTIKNNSVTGGEGGVGSDGGVNANNNNAMGGQGGAGGMAAGAGLYVSTGSVQLQGDTIQANTALGGKGNVGGSGGNVESSGHAATGASGEGGVGEGGGIFVNAGSVQVLTSTIQNNAATGGSNLMSNAGVHTGGNGMGGGIFLQRGSIVVGSSTLAGNVANGGGATYSPGSAYGGAAAIGAGDALFDNDTIALNGTTPGGGFANNSLGGSFGGAFADVGGNLELLNDTIANNTANPGVAFNGTSGGNAFGGAVASLAGTVNMANTILAFNNAYNPLGISSEILGVINSSSHDLIDNAFDPFGSFTPGGGDLIGVDPSLKPLGSYGGPTQTMPLLPGSLGIDAGANFALQGPATLAALADWWRGEGNAGDSAGTNSGTINGGVSFSQGVSGQAFNLDGNSGSYVDFGTGPDIVGTGAFTLGVWIRTTADGTILNQRDPANFNGEYYLGIQGGKVQWYTYGNSKFGFNFDSNQSVNDDNWHFITVTRLANGTGQIYIDGKLDSSRTGTAVPLIGGVHVYLGEDVRDAVAYGPAYGANFTGQIDEVQIYHQGLAATQIQSLSNPASYTPIGFTGTGAWPTTLPGLVSWLPGDGNFADVAGTNAGTPQGGVSFTGGKFGKAFQLNGTTGQINIADSPSLDSPGFTVGGWFQLTQAPASGSEYFLASKYDGNYHGWILRVNSSRVPTLSVLSSSSSNINVTSSTPLALNQWYYLSATFDSSSDQATLYINGTAVGSGYLNGGYTASATPLVIGAASWANGGHFAGKVEQFAFYNHALTPGELSLLTTSVLPKDQRGGARTLGTNVDIGATEYQYDLAVTGTATATATPGGTITYTLTVTNKGLDSVSGITFSDTLPTGVTFQGLSTPFGWAIGRPSAQTILAYGGAGLAPGATATFVVTAVVNNTTPAGTVLTNKVSISPTSYDSNTGNNALSQSTTVVAATGVDIHGQPHNALAGQSIGPVRVAVVDANGHTITGSKPTPVTLSIYSGPKGAVLEGTTTVWSVNGVATFTNLALSEAGTYVLKATSGKLDADYSNAILIKPADVSNDVAVQKGELNLKPGSSDIWVQTVTITNTSHGALHGPMALVLTNLPADVTLLKASGSYEGKPCIDVLDPKQALAPGHKVMITLRFQVTGLQDPDDLRYATKELLGI